MNLLRNKKPRIFQERNKKVFYKIVGFATKFNIPSYACLMCDQTGQITFHQNTIHFPVEFFIRNFNAVSHD